MRKKARVPFSSWLLSLSAAALVACSSENPAAPSGPPGADAAQPDGATSSDSALPDGPTSSDAALPDATLAPCDFHAQDCAAASEKCSIVSQPAGYGPVCVPRQGQLQPGEICQRMALGYDSCAAGSLCSPAAMPGANSMACRTICDGTLQCTNPDRCYRFSLGQPEIYGMCVPVCRYFETDCGPGRHCLLVADAEGIAFPICDDHGTFAEGDPCQNANQCGKDMACARLDGVSTCRLYCDPGHACPLTSSICRPLGLSGFPGLGVCIPP